MITTTSTFNTNVIDTVRDVASKIIIGTTEITQEDLVALSIDSALCSSDEFGFGNVVSAEAQITILINENTPSLIVGQKIKIYVQIGSE